MKFSISTGQKFGHKNHKTSPIHLDEMIFECMTGKKNISYKCTFQDLYLKRHRINSCKSSNKHSTSTGMHMISVLRIIARFQKRTEKVLSESAQQSTSKTHFWTTIIVHVTESSVIFFQSYSSYFIINHFLESRRF